jgi:hypothetical protein
MKCVCVAVQTCLYYVHTYICIHERVCTMYIHACTYMYIHDHDFMKMSEHVHTCLYNVQTRMYRFAQSCPGGQDSRSFIASIQMERLVYSGLRPDPPEPNLVQPVFPQHTPVIASVHSVFHNHYEPTSCYWGAAEMPEPELKPQRVTSLPMITPTPDHYESNNIMFKT